MTDALVMKLSGYSDLSEADRHQLRQLVGVRSTIKAGKDIAREGEPLDRIILIVEGWAYRYKLLPNGKRHIIAYLLPGDMLDPNVLLLNQLDDSIGAISTISIKLISSDSITGTGRQSPAIARAMLLANLVEAATSRQWLVNLGQRSAFDRIAHLLCELLVRASRVGLVVAGGFDFPLTQEQLADTMGLTSVHVNRVLQRMRSEKLIHYFGKRLTVLDLDGLQQIAGFNPSYLHLRSGC